MKKVISFLNIFILIVSLIFVPLPTSAASNPQELKTDWFDTKNWWATDNYTENNWRFEINIGNDGWTYHLKAKGPWDAGYTNSYGTPVYFNTEQFPKLFISADLKAESSSLFLRFNSNDRVKVADLKRGKNVLTVDLNSVSELQKYRDANGGYTVNGVGFTTDKFVDGDEITFTEFKFSDTEKYTFGWFEASNDKYWYNDDWAFDGSTEGRFIINHPNGAKWQYYHRWCGTKRSDFISFNEILDFSKFNELTVDVPYSDVVSALTLRIRPYDKSTGKFSEDVKNIKVCEIQKGNSSPIKVDLFEIAEIRNAVSPEGNICICGMGIGLENITKYGQVINFNSISIASKERKLKGKLNYIGNLFAQKGKGGNIKFTADMLVPVPQKVIYNWYLDGELLSEANGKDCYISNDTVGFHSVKCVASYLDKQFETENIIFGSYILSDADLNGVTDSKDLVKFKKALLGLIDLDELTLKAVDVNEDGNLNLIDLVMCKKIISGIIEIPEIKESNDLLVQDVVAAAPVYNGKQPNEDSYMTFYIDNINGNDSYIGNSPDKPWKTLKRVNETLFNPGTKILLKRGCVFNELLRPATSGTKDKYFIIDAYGEGNKPKINGNGSESAVELVNNEYIDIRNLEVTNQGDSNSVKYGVKVTAGRNNGGVRHNIYLSNLDVHDVTSNNGHFIGGIMLGSHASNIPSYFENVVVQNCTVRNVGGSGISMASDYTGVPGADWSYVGHYPSKNIAIRGNNIENCASDGIVISCAENTLIEHNTVNNTCYGETPYAGIWPHAAKNTVMQYNEVYGTRLVGGDGQGFDVDISCENTVVQYNYSHDNEGGFLLLCTSSSNGTGYNKNITVRYNISQNDLSQIFTLSGIISDVKIYNNTVYTKSGLKTNLVGSYDWDEGFSPKDAKFFNNIFYMNSEGYNSLIIPERIKFDTNLFYGTHNFGDLISTNTIKSNPLFISAGTGKLGFDTLNGYKLNSNSPCINKGITINQNGGWDFFGNKLPQTNGITVGAFQSDCR